MECQRTTHRHHRSSSNGEWAKEGRTASTCASKHSFRSCPGQPLRRAIETCEIAGFGAKAQIDRGLMEWNYGKYEGLTPAQIEEKAPGWLLFKDGAPGGETPEQVSARVDRVIARARAAKGNVALFGHGHLLRVLAARWLGLPASAGSHFLLGTGTLNVLSYYREVPVIETWNCTVE